MPSGSQAEFTERRLRSLDSEAVRAERPPVPRERARGRPGSTWSCDAGDRERESVRLAARTAPSGAVEWTGERPDRRSGTGRACGIVATFRLAADAGRRGSGTVGVENHASDTEVVVDVVLTHDLGPRASRRGPHQRVLRQPVPRPHPGRRPGHGTALASGRTCPGRAAPWALSAALGAATAGRPTPSSWSGAAARGCAVAAVWPADLPSHRLQHEHTLVGLQDRPITRWRPARARRTGFFGIVLADHPEATSTGGRRGSPARPWPTRPRRRRPSTSRRRRRPVDRGGAVTVRAAPDLSPLDDLDRGPARPTSPARTTRADVETATTGRCSRRSPRHGGHLVTAAKQRARAPAARPHPAHRSTRSSPDERSLTVDGLDGRRVPLPAHPGPRRRGPVLSLRRTYLGLSSAPTDCALFVADPTAPDDWRLLGPPSRLVVCARRLPLVVRTDGRAWSRSPSTAADRPPRARARGCAVLDGPPLRLLAALHVALAGDDGPTRAASEPARRPAGRTVRRRRERRGAVPRSDGPPRLAAGSGRHGRRRRGALRRTARSRRPALGDARRPTATPDWSLTLTVRTS